MPKSQATDLDDDLDDMMDNMTKNNEVDDFFGGPKKARPPSAAP